jgi:hypothetical protein
MRRVNLANDDYEVVRSILLEIAQLQRQQATTTPNGAEAFRLYSELFTAYHDAGMELYRFGKDDAAAVRFLRNAGRHGILMCNLLRTAQGAQREGDWGECLRAVSVSVCFLALATAGRLGLFLDRLDLRHPDGDAGCHRLLSLLLARWAESGQLQPSHATALLSSANQATLPYVRNSFGALAKACLELNDTSRFLACLGESMAAHVVECFEGEFQYSPAANIALPQLTVLRLARLPAESLSALTSKYGDYLPLHLLAGE